MVRLRLLCYGYVMVRFGYIKFIHSITQKLGFSTLDFFIHDLGNKILKSYVTEPNLN